jgi:large subunit ribosomal protein L10
MAKTKEQKKQIVTDLSDKLSQFKALVFAGFNKLTVKESREFKKLCRENKLDYLVTKKKLFKIALEKNKLELDPKNIEGEIALIISRDDEVIPAKLATQFIKEHEAMTIKGGILESRWLDVNSVKELAKIPAKPELLAKLIGSLQSLIRGLVSVLQGNLRGLVQVLKAIQEQKQ